MLDLLHIERLLLVILGLAGLLNPCDLLLLLQREIHPLCHFLLLSDHVLAELVELVLRLQLDPFSLFQRLRQALPSRLLARRQLRLLLLDVPQLRVVDVIIFPLLFLHLNQVRLEFHLSLLGELGLEHQSALRRLVEEVCAVCQSIVAELLGDALRVGSLRTFLDEVVQEAKDLEVEALQTIILIIV